MEAIRYVKQYGYYRCGTNYTACLLEKNFRGLRVITNGLGCKHDPPVDWERWLRDNERLPAHDRKNVPANLQGDVEANRVPVVVTVKHPLAWLASFLRYWRRRKPRSEAVTPSFVRERCRTYSHNVVAWLAMERPVVTVRWEDIAVDPTDWLRWLQETWELEPANDFPAMINTRVDPHEHIRGDPFDPAYYLDGRYLNELSDEHRGIAQEAIDWTLFANFDYHPEPTCVSSSA